MKIKELVIYSVKYNDSNMKQFIKYQTNTTGHFFQELSCFPLSACELEQW